MEQAKIDRINQLARKSRTPEGLSEQEKTEQAALRREYIDAFKSSLRVQLDHTQVIGPDGVRRPLEKKQP
ncbi:DUF896 domain-containing protein [Allofournierella sp.]|uniref:DUF896 domain-containing protein n=1 Tax=Allofournierella sp. TaxID=1940256 RepID=UPI003AF598CE